MARVRGTATGQTPIRISDARKAPAVQSPDTSFRNPPLDLQWDGVGMRFYVVRLRADAAVWPRSAVRRCGDRVPFCATPPLCDIPSGCCSFTGPWTVTRSSLRMLRLVAAFCRPLRPVLLLVSFPRSRSPVVGVLGLCWMWRDVPFACQRRPIIGVLRMCWLLPGSFDCFCCPHTSVHRPSIACLAVFLCGVGIVFPFCAIPPPPGGTGRHRNMFRPRLVDLTCHKPKPKKAGQ